MVDGLRQVHAAGFLHRDIKPANIFVRRSDESPVLLDFGSARQALGRKSRSMTAIASAGYSPPEQYESDGEQGPWTDIYALSALCHRAITGKAPVEAPRRQSRLLRSQTDPLPRLADMPAAGYSPAFLQAVDRGLAVIETERPQSLDEWLPRLERAATPPPSLDTESRRTKQPAAHPTPHRTDERKAGKGAGRAAWLAAGSLLVIALVWLVTRQATEHPFTVQVDPADAHVRILNIGLPYRGGMELAAGSYKVEASAPGYRTKTETVAHGTAPTLHRMALSRLGIRITPQSPLHPFTVQVDPADARVRILNIGSPYRARMELAAGSYEVEASAPGYVTKTETVTHGTAPTLHHMALSRHAQPFTVQVEPADARVRILNIGSPYRARMALAAGSYEVEASAPGYATKTETVAHGSVPTLHRMSLSPLGQPFTVQVEPAQARVRLLDHGAVYQPGMQLPPGSYRVEASATGYKTVTEIVAHGSIPTVRRFVLQKAVPERFRDCAVCPEMVALPAGTFRMGSPLSEQGRQGHEGHVRVVSIGASFAIGRHEVTVSEFRRFVDQTGYSAGSSCWATKGRKMKNRKGRDWRNPGFDQSGRHPVVCVSWDDAQAYAAWLSRETGEAYRLPSESEWEYAARAGTVTARHWGEGESDQCRHANGADASTDSFWTDFIFEAGCNDGHARTSPVGTYASNDWDLHDMLGNVLEWTGDCWNHSHAGGPVDGSAWEDGDCSRRVARGGSWANKPSVLRAAARFQDTTGIRSFNIGFRVVRTIAP